MLWKVLKMSEVWSEPWPPRAARRQDPAEPSMTHFSQPAVRENKSWTERERKMLGKIQTERKRKMHLFSPFLSEGILCPHLLRGERIFLFFTFCQFIPPSTSHLSRVRNFPLAQERESFGPFLLGHIEQAVNITLSFQSLNESFVHLLRSSLNLREPNSPSV